MIKNEMFPAVIEEYISIQTSDTISTLEFRGHPELNWGPLDLQSNALPLSYTPT